MRSLVLVSTLFFLLACSQPESLKSLSAGTQEGPHIVGGIETESNFDPARSVVMITLDSENGETHICTGTFIARNLVLTAAHCVSKDPERMGLLYGIRPFGGDFTKLPIQRIFSHERAFVDKDERNDIAIIQLSGGLPPGAQLAWLPLAIGSTNHSTSFTALGYGATTGVNSQEGSNGVGVLRMATLQFEKPGPDGKSLIASQLHGRGVCFGDSGGPAMSVSNSLLDGRSTVILGIASGVFSEKSVNENAVDFDFCKQKSIYTDVSAYLDWIEKIRKLTVAP